MPLLTKERTLIDDRWALLPETAAIADVPPSTPAIVPLALWSAQHDVLAVRADTGVWLKSADDPDALAGDIARLPLIAVDFPKFSDGRGYSTARLLREKYRYTGELRAIGEILRDQLHYLWQCGFDTFALQPGRNVDEALAAFGDFTDHYQATVAQPAPLFRRRLQAAAADAAASESSRR